MFFFNIFIYLGRNRKKFNKYFWCKIKIKEIFSIVDIIWYQNDKCNLFFILVFYSMIILENLIFLVFSVLVINVSISNKILYNCI